MLNLGIDITEKKRIKNLYFKYKEKFVLKILNFKEYKIFKKKKKKIEFLAKIFSLKEALTKTLGTGVRYKINLKKIIILNNTLGKPYLYKFKKFFFIVSLSHEKNCIFSMVFLINLKYL